MNFIKTITKSINSITKTITNSRTELTDNEIIQSYLTACATHIQWLLDRVRIENDQLTIEGWAIVTQGNHKNVRFLINGKNFEEVNYPIPSPDLGEIYWNIPAAQNARFICKTKINQDKVFSDGFVRFEFLQNDCRELARKTAWYLHNPNQELPFPEDERIARVIGTADLTSYIVGGSTLFKRFEQYLKQNFSCDYSNFRTILDWGCGSGRLARYFYLVPNSEIWGVDIDEDNINWCRDNLKHGQFLQVPLYPPTNLPEDYFDLIIGISVLTHLNEKHQFAWLGELKRIAKKGAILMISVQGLSQAGLERMSPEIIRDMNKKGFKVIGNNTDIDEVIADKNYYLGVMQSRKYIYEKWGKYFEVLDIVDGIAANQDLVVMRN